jgi:S-methylmethionine-dependent homocysteine/selenocysteine methylase
VPGLQLTDGGLETSLIFHQGLDLPLFAAFPLVETEGGRAALRRYWEPYLALARERDVGFVLDTATWRANPDWAAQLGYDAQSLQAVNGAAVAFARELAADQRAVVIEGVVGPRGDGYVVGEEMRPDEAAEYHAEQLDALAEAGVDQVAAVTLTYPQEAIGVIRAATAAGLSCIISFTVETDGRLPNGATLRDATETVDAETGGAAAGFMINCAHPTHFEHALEGGPWLDRIIGIRANASTMSHAELDAADALDDGDPEDLARRYQALMGRLPAVQVLGGCCGTDLRHIRAISDACLGS